MKPSQRPFAIPLPLASEESETRRTQKAEKEAARIAAVVSADAPFDHPASSELTAAGLTLITQIAKAAGAAGVHCEVDEDAIRLKFVGGDNLLVKMTKAIAGSLKTDMVFAPVQLAIRGSNGTFVHSPRTLLMSDLGVRTLCPQTTELHEARHAYHFALHREGRTPTILDSRLMPAMGEKQFIVPLAIRAAFQWMNW